MNLNKKKLEKYLKISGITIMALYIGFGLFSFTTLPDGMIEQFWFYKAFADDLTEGHNYYVVISDSIEVSQILR